MRKIRNKSDPDPAGKKKFDTFHAKKTKPFTVMGTLWSGFVLIPVVFTIGYCCMGMFRMKNTPVQVLNVSRISANPAGEFLRPFLQPRTPGSYGSKQVQTFLISNFVKKLGWHLEIDSFQAPVPIPGVAETKPQSFTNLIFTKNPKAKKRLILAAHYDSKIRVDDQKFDGQFIGATDSAWPCALLVELAHALEATWPRKQHKNDTTLQIIFFDGEEAQVHWGPNDSVYGAKNLAAKWAKDMGRVKEIDLFILFDLLGAENPTFHSSIPKTQAHFEHLMRIERKLKSEARLTGYSKRDQSYFFTEPALYGVEDDHTPFLPLGIPILHIIPVPFPKVWHSVKDDESALHNPTIQDLSLIFYHFLLDYFGLEAPKNSLSFNFQRSFYSLFS